MKIRRTYLPALVLIVATFAVAQTPATPAVLKPSDNLVVEGIPPIPLAIAEQANRYTEVRSAGFSSWHPVRREMLISTRFGDTAQVHEVKMPGGARTQLTFFPDRVAGARYEPTTGKYFIFAKDVGGGEWFQIYRYDLPSGEITLLTDGKSRNLGGLFSHRGDRILYTSTRRTGQDTDIWMMNPLDPKSDRMLLQLQGGGWAPQDWSADDTKFLLMEEVSANESYIWLVDAASGEKKLITPKGGAEKIAYGDAKFAKDGKGIYVTTDKDSEFQRLAYIDLATMQHTFLTSDIPWDVDEMQVSDDGRTIAFVTNENGSSVLRLMDTASRKQRLAPKLPMGVVGGLRWHKNNRDIGFSMTSARATGDAYSVDTANGQLTRWTFSETGGLNAETFAAPELIKWKSFDGREISGFLYR